jgi:hypothetical protein
MNEYEYSELHKHTWVTKEVYKSRSDEKFLIDTPKMPVKNNGVSNYLVYRGFRLFRGWETHFAALPNE